LIGFLKEEKHKEHGIESSEDVGMSNAEEGRSNRFTSFNKNDIPVAVPDFLRQSTTKRFVEVKSGEVLYLKENGECFYQKNKSR
jgi:hypothetical protein